MSGYEGLTPAQELELRQRRERETEQARNAEVNAAIRAAYRRLKGIRRPGSGRPVEITWGMVVDAYQALRSEGEKATQPAVAERLRCSLDTVKKRSRDNGGWPPRQ